MGATHTAGRFCALLLTLTLTVPLQAAEEVRPPDYGLEGQYAEAPDLGKPLPVHAPQEYYPPQLLESPEVEVEPPLIQAEESEEERDLLTQNEQEDSEAAQGPMTVVDDEIRPAGIDDK